ncbi:unnamed protein product [Absidia cylindrospora]
MPFRLIHDGSDKDSVRHKTPTESLPSRYAALRKTDLLDALDSFRSRDTDSWSVAATIDDQEFVISTQGNGGGGLVGLSSSTTTLDTIHTPTNDDISSSSLDNRVPATSTAGDSTLVCGTAISSTVGDSNSSNMVIDNNELHLNGMILNGGSSLGLPMETLRDLDNDRISDDDDRRSRSNAAEFGDDGNQSAAADFDVDSDSEEASRRSDDNGTEQHNSQEQYGAHQRYHQTEHEQHTNHQYSYHSSTSDRRHQHHDVVNDSIAASPQPQPSFAPVTKSYVELLEENDILQSQIHNLRITQKHQVQVIDNLRSLTSCSEKVFDKAINLSELTSNEQQHLLKTSQVQPRNQQHVSSSQHQQPPEQISPGLQPQQMSMMEEDEQRRLQKTAATTSSIIMHNHTMTELLERLYEQINQFVAATVGLPWQLSLQQALFSAITDAYLVVLPFGTDNQQLLNTAYRDQLRRFKLTLGSSFAKWYRRQTVQSLSLNPATKEYLEHMQEQLTLQLMELLTKQGMQTSNQQATATAAWVDQAAWMDVLHSCRLLSLEIHGGEADVVVQPISAGVDFDADIMTAVIVDDASAKYIVSSSSSSNNNNSQQVPSSTGNNGSSTKKVKWVLSPLFIDEDDQVLFTAKVLLDD